MGDVRLVDAVDHERFMERALDLALRGAGKVSPNPMVGAVIVKNGRVIAGGYHHRRGGLHAERDALSGADRDEISGATMYVTLEPCCHEGLTPPCTEAIIESGISRVVVGSPDPNPLVSGGGIARLRSHGVIVEQGVLQSECERINEVFNHFITHRTPYVVMKYAMTADGKIAASTGDSQWITGEEARNRVHALRGRLAAVMVGIGTVIADDPLLTCRHGGGRNPLRVVCDSQLRIPLDSKIVRTAASYPTIVATISEDYEKKQALQNLGITVLTTKPKDARVDLGDLMRQLGLRDIDGLLLEGGARLNYSALDQSLVQRVTVHVGAKILGDADGISPVAGGGVTRMAQAFRLSLENVDMVDNDILLDYKVKVKEGLCSRES